MLVYISLVTAGVGLILGLTGMVFVHFRPRKRAPIEGKHVLITGGSLGIGKAIALEVAKRGAHVTLVARNVSNLEKTAEEIRQAAKDATQKVQCLSMDLSGDFEVMKRKIDEAEEESGPVYMLVNNAGTSVCGKLEDIKDSDIQYLCNLNILGTILPTKAVISKMKERGEGKVVITSSQAGLIGVYGFSVYSATKFALRGFAEALLMEVKPYGVSVTLSLPPDTDTPGFADENKMKPEETRLISEAAGLFSAETVAKQTVNDTLEGNFFSTVGFESAVLTSLCSGMAPAKSALYLLGQILSIGILRFVGVITLNQFNTIILDCKKKREKAASASAAAK